MTTATRNDVISRKIDELIDQGRDQATALLARLQSDQIEDAIVPIGPGANGSGPEVVFDGREVGIACRGRTRSFHRHAATQFGTKLGIPSAWLRESLGGKPWQKALIADVMATHLSHTETRERLLLRAVGDEVRGVLSDQYRRFDSPMIATGFADACQGMGAVPYRAYVRDIHWNVSAMLPRPIQVELPHHGTEFVAACVHLRSSDFGAGPLELSFELLRVICVNGLIGRSALRQVHLGRRLPDELRLSAETYRLDSQTQASVVRDVTMSLLDEGWIREQVGQVKGAASKEIEPTQELGGLVRAKRITKGEAEEVEAVLMRGDEAQVPPGPCTRWKVAQAISWVAKEQEERQGELERLAGGMVLGGAS